MQPEAQLSKRIREKLTSMGAFVFKVHGSGMMMAGLPDLIVCYKGLYIGLEVKMPAGVVSPVQTAVHEKIRRAWGCAAVVRSVEEAVEVVTTWGEDV